MDLKRCKVFSLLNDLRFSKQQTVDEGVTGSCGMETEILGEKPAPVSLCPPQISCELTWDRTRASAGKGRQITA